MIVFFFFQAEDGIRDYKVTGVQTCALPISSWTWMVPSAEMASEAPESKTAWARRTDVRRSSFSGLNGIGMVVQIGRASCRERGWGTVVDGRGGQRSRTEEMWTK